MKLAQLTPDAVDVTVSDTNYAFVQNTLRPSFFLKSLLNIMLGAAGVASFIFLLWGGLQWITAGGDKDAVEKARKKIIGALIGLIIVFSCYATLYFVRVLFNVNLIEVQISQIGSDWGGGSGPPPPGSTPPPGVTPTLPPGCGPCACHGGGHAAIGIMGPVGIGGDCYMCNAGGWGPPIIPAGSPGCPVSISCTCP